MAEAVFALVIVKWPKLLKNAKKLKKNKEEEKEKILGPECSKCC